MKKNRNLQGSLTNTSYSKSAVSGSAWTILERFGANGVSFIVSIILARLLSPEAYGAIALITIFIQVSDILIQSGLGMALIQNKDVTDVDFSSVFIFNIILSTCIYIIVFLSAPAIAGFYNMEVLSPVLRVLATGIFWGGINNVQQAYVSKKMQFRLFFYATITGTIISGIFGIISAYCGLGIWSLVIQQLTNRVINTLVLWFKVKWRPKKCFSISRFLVLFKFGWKLLVKSLIEVIYSNLYALIIGKTQSGIVLGYYNRGQSFPSFLAQMINVPMQKVLFPLFSKMNSDINMLKSSYRRAVQVGSFVVAPLMFGLAAISDNLVILLLTDKWANASVFSQLWCFSYAFSPILIQSQQVIGAMGKAGILLKVEILQKITGVLFLVLTVRYGLIIMMYGYIGYVLVSTFISMLMLSKHLPYPIKNQIIDTIPHYLISLVIYVIVSKIWVSSSIISLVVQIIVGILTYATISSIITKDTFDYCIAMLKTSHRKRSENSV